MEDITDSYYNYAKRVSNKFGDFYLKSNTLLLADVFENSRNMYLEIYQLKEQDLKVYKKPKEI